MIDFSEPILREQLHYLLKDRTTGKNIIWATEPPQELGVGFTDEITLEQVIQHPPIPRVQKRLEEQKARTRKKAEVFTPTHICKKMIDLGFEEDALSKDGMTFLKQTCFEVACGEAPFLTSRYDTTTGEKIAIPDRIGLLDRKLKVVTEHFANDYSLWLNWALEACISTYGCEWQGDNLLLARANVFLTVIENFRELFGDKQLYKSFAPVLVDCIADTISWNLWQMDFLKGTIPGTDIPCRIMDWENGKDTLYKEMKD